MRKENCRTFLTLLRFCVEVDGPSSVLKSPAIFCKMTMTIYLFSYAKKGEFILCIIPLWASPHFLFLSQQKWSLHLQPTVKIRKDAWSSKQKPKDNNHLQL